MPSDSVCHVTHDLSHPYRFQKWGNKLTNLVLTANKLKLESERESITRLEGSGGAFCETIENCSPCAISWHLVFEILVIDID